MFHITGGVKIQELCPEDPDFEREDGMGGPKGALLVLLGILRVGVKVIAQTEAWCTCSFLFSYLRPTPATVSNLPALSQWLRYCHH